MHLCPKCRNSLHFPFHLGACSRWRFGNRSRIPRRVCPNSRSGFIGCTRPIHDRLWPAPRLLDERDPFQRSRWTSGLCFRGPLRHFDRRTMVSLGSSPARDNRSHHQRRWLGMALDACSCNDPSGVPLARYASHARVRALVCLERALLRGHWRA